MVTGTVVYVAILVAVSPDRLSVWLAFSPLVAATGLNGVYAAFLTAERRYPLAILRVPIGTGIAARRHCRRAAVLGLADRSGARGDGRPGGDAGPAGRAGRRRAAGRRNRVDLGVRPADLRVGDLRLHAAGRAARDRGRALPRRGSGHRRSRAAHVRPRDRAPAGHVRAGARERGLPGGGGAVQGARAGLARAPGDQRDAAERARRARGDGLCRHLQARARPDRLRAPRVHRAGRCDDGHSRGDPGGGPRRGPR